MNNNNKFSLSNTQLYVYALFSLDVFEYVTISVTTLNCFFAFNKTIISIHTTNLIFLRL